jgi:hypothetical protein
MSTGNGPNRVCAGRSPGGAMIFVAINIFAAYALLLADDLMSSADMQG